MRLPLLVASVSFTSLACLALACGSTDSSGVAGDEDGGASSSGTSGKTSSSGGSSTSSSSSSSSSSSGSSGDAGASGAIGTPLKTGDAVVVDVTADGQVVYVAINGNAGSLEAVPVGGGQAAVLDNAFDPQKDPAGVSGAVVGWWKTVDANGIGTFNMWTKAVGAKTAVATGSVSGVFAGSDDGSKVAFSVNGTQTSTDLAVTSTSAPSATAVLAGTTNTGTGLNLAAQNCQPDVGFVGKRLFTAHCPGTSANAVNARLFTVADGATTPVRLDAASASATGVVKAQWVADKAGTKVFAIQAAAAAAGLLYDVGAPGAPLATLDQSTTRGFFTDDGTGFVYRTTANANAGVRRATVAANPAPITLVANGELLSTSVDKTKILVSLLPPANNLVDIQLANTTQATQTPAAVVATATARPVGFTQGGTHVVYLTDVTNTGNTLKAKPVAGGSEVTIAKDVAGLARGPGGYLVLLSNPVAAGQNLSTYDISIVDVTKSGTPTKLSDSALSDFYVSGSKVVYTRLSQTGGGIYAADMP